MTEAVRICGEHGPFSAERGRCPGCGSRGARLLSGSQRRRLSTFVSGALRHFPDDVGLELDERGRADYDALVAAVERKYDWADASHVAAVVATDPKGRFERTNAGTGTGGGDGDAGDGGRIRAAYGHSVGIDLEPTDAPIPDELYHGTAPSNVDSIREAGLRPMARQRVHLSRSRDAARTVGRRHADEPIILAVDARAMLADGHRIAKRGQETYTTDAVPPVYLTVDRDGV
ncbi:RNA 2'-phosphotransferase [Natrinema sp. 1APR25-10V2]|uniref:RNA 2'-phosphotransferase n=1 Tax=Natrinema sp. 1APR25-10V2 TaxID=2951081 RepID=UPI0028771BC9|nr:RNA 2'-phosphotransferase [Natrinema sp. 1APR25-10V2]MDS0475890.1 RNA 2'-phosphotransferase [Natrinema sp. 1APR25-10V2]